MVGVSGAGRAFIPSSRGDHTTIVVGQLKEGESCSLKQGHPSSLEPGSS